MARSTAQITVGQNTYETFKGPAALTDLDVGKPVKISATDEVELCADGDQIYGFIAGVEPALADGKKVVSVLTAGRVKVALSGASAIGTIVEAAANTAAGVAKAGDYGLVSTHTAVVGTNKRWMVISGTGLDGATVLIEKQ